jgi:hypothetical protein
LQKEKVKQKQLKKLEFSYIDEVQKELLTLQKENYFL